MPIWHHGTLGKYYDHVNLLMLIVDKTTNRPTVNSAMEASQGYRPFFVEACSHEVGTVPQQHVD